MEYRVLARKYRPQKFADLVGQDVLVRTLSNAFASGRVAHAFLLTGIRGIGKTTTARIIARALNCIGADGKGNATIEPCGVCSNCTMIAEGRHMDILEMDAASHTGVDDIRDLISTVQYLPSSARTKVYIIDEVHMLSNNAFNALLKTLEEPPAHVKFIFATTELRKIPVTILSRCQRFDLKRLDIEQLSKHLGNICAKESVQAEAEALTLIANAAEGSVRDGLSLLDQAIAHTDNGGVINAITVRNMLGMNDKSQLFTMLEKLFSGDISGVLAEFRKLYADGSDPAILLQDLLTLIHFITRIKITPNAANDIAFSESERTFAKSISEKAPISALTKFWQMLLKGLQETKNSPDPAASAEMTLIRIAHSSDLPSPTDLIRKIRSEKPSNAPINSTNSPSPSGNAPISLITTNQIVREPAPQAFQHFSVMPKSFAEVAEMFNAKREILLYNSLLRHARLVKFEQGKIEINLDKAAPNDFAGRVGKSLTEWTGQRWLIVLSHEAGEETMQTKIEAKFALEKEAIKSNQLVAKVLEQFAGSEVTNIIKRD